LEPAAQAQDYPKVEVFGGYSYFHSQAGTSFTVGQSFNGASGSVAVNPNRWLGLAGDFGFYHSHPGDVSDNIFSYVFGPKIAYRSHEQFTPYFHALFGGAHVCASVRGGSCASSGNSFAFAVGGGLDLRLTQNIAARAVQAEYVRTDLTDFADNRHNNVRISAGIVFRWGSSK